ncbi:MAG: VanZ family protein [Desulfobacterales bacterium]|jgi:VanZ family protein|nr:VanZ family protein [Desulfobacteraceae bacterium]MDD3991790.1 VanZ family protein [Desulfobacteraceae bacterium]MDY0311377.1 VanZ family protein [Desulfobacterales bacterium]
MPFNLHRSAWWRWGLVAVYAVAIFVQSALPSVVSPPGGMGLDKVAHMGAYGLMAVLLCRALAASPMAKRSPWQIAVVAMLLATLYGVSDELHQALVPRRCADVGDVLADLVGSAVGAAIWVRRHLKSET